MNKFQKLNDILLTSSQGYVFITTFIFGWIVMLFETIFMTITLNSFKTTWTEQFNKWSIELLTIIYDKQIENLFANN